MIRPDVADRIGGSGGAGHPWYPVLAWWLLATGGAVLAVVDAQTFPLPARLVYPLAIAVGCVLLVAAISGGDFPALFRAGAAAAAIGGIWLGVRVISPPAMCL